MKNLLEFIRRYAAIFLFIALEIISVTLVSFSTSYRQWKGSRITREITGPVLRMRSKASGYFHLRKENNELHAFQSRLLQIACNTDVGDSCGIQDFTDSLNQPLFSYMEADIIDNTTFLSDNYIVLDKGSRDGILPGQGVLSERGVVGIVKDVSPHFCTVISLLHSKFNLSAIQKVGIVTGVICWDGKNHRKAIMRNVSSLDQIKVGDTLLTHHSLLFPPQYPIGTVYRIRNEVEDGFYTIEVRLSNPFDRMTRVWVVRNNFHEELQNLIEQETDE